jgi:hypothetical protein
MKVVDGMTDMVEFPIEETDRIMDAMEQAEKAGDLPALQWCARFLRWLWNEGGIMETDNYCYSEDLFNKMWDSLLKSDPAPESIAAIINRKEEFHYRPSTAADAEKTLDTLKVFFEENIPRKVIAAALSSVDAMREAVKTAGAGK